MLTRRCPENLVSAIKVPTLLLKIKVMLLKKVRKMLLVSSKSRDATVPELRLRTNSRLS